MKKSAIDETLGGFITIRFDKIQEFNKVFSFIKTKAPSCEIRFTTEGIDDIDYVGVKWTVSSPADFDPAYNFFCISDAHCKKQKIEKEDYSFKLCNDIPITAVQEILQQLKKQQKKGLYKDCIFFCSLSPDFSHGHIHFYSNNFIKDCQKFQKWYERSKFNTNNLKSDA